MYEIAPWEFGIEVLDIGFTNSVEYFIAVFIQQLQSMIQTFELLGGHRLIHNPGKYHHTGLILGFRPANERRRYLVTDDVSH